MPTKSNNAYLTVLRIYPMDSTEDRLNGKEKLMTARLLKSYAEERNPNGYYLTEEEDIKLFEQIEQIIRELPPSEKDMDYRRLWLSIPRGPIEDFGNFDDYKDEGYTYDEFVDCWKYEHPDETDWYVFFYEKMPKGGRYLGIDRLVLFCGEENTLFRHRSEYHTDLLKWLVEAVREQVDSVKAGTYHDRVVKELPIGYRKGVVKRSDIWNSGYWTRENDLKGTTEDDIRRFSELVDGGIEQKPAGRIPSITVNDYLKLCSICFEISGKETKDMTLKEQYMRFADGRHDGMLDIDPDDPEAFKNFCNTSHGGHVWEIRPGHGFSRMHLYVQKDDEGWYLVLSGCFDRTDFVHIAIELTARGLPLMVYDAKKVLKAMKGEDFIGIVPRGDFPYYCSQYFSDHDVLDCVSFEDEMLEKFGDKIEWYEVDTFYPVKE